MSVHKKGNASGNVILHLLNLPHWTYKKSGAVFLCESTRPTEAPARPLAAAREPSGMLWPGWPNSVLPGRCSFRKIGGERGIHEGMSLIEYEKKECPEGRPKDLRGGNQ